MLTTMMLVAALNAPAPALPSVPALSGAEERLAQVANRGRPGTTRPPSTGPNDRQRSRPDRPNPARRTIRRPPAQL